MADLDFLQECVQKRDIIWRIHALERLVLRKISREEIIEVLLTGEVIEEYPQDKPYPSLLLLGKTKLNRILHIVCAMDKDNHKLFIISLYEPDSEQWSSDFRKRK